MVHTHDVTMIGDVARKRFVSWNAGEPEREWAALQLLARMAPGLAPVPIRREHLEGGPIVVMSRVPGEPLSGTLSPAEFDGLIVALRRLFAVPVPEGLAGRANGPEQLRIAVLIELAADHDLSCCLDAGLVQQAKVRAADWLQSLCLPEATDRVIALGDGNLDNVLWDGEVCRLIDWEEYGVSDLAYEIAALVEHASSRLTRSLDVDAVVDALAKGVGQRARVETYRRLFACFWLMKLLPGHSGFERNPAGSTEAQARHVLALLRGHRE